MKYEEDILILTDENDRETGTALKMITHRKGWLHRAFSVLIRDQEKNSMLIQKRAAGKYHSGGLWTNACCSHPRAGETLEEAVNRRLQSELGLSASFLSKQKIIYCGWFHYFARFDGLAENENDHVFLINVKENDIPLHAFDPEEISELKWIGTEELEKQMEENPDLFTAWFRPAYEKAGEYTGEER